MNKFVIHILSFAIMYSCTNLFCVARPAEKIRIALFIDKGAHARSQIFDTLGNDRSVYAQTVYGEDIRSGCLKDFDVLFMPGGSGKKEAISLEENGKDEVRRFVKDGGIYVGVCAGCYLASCARPEYLGLIPATTVDKEHWRRGKATLPIEFTQLGMQIFGIDRANVDVIYHNGPVLKIYDNYKNDVTPLCYFRGEAVASGGQSGLMVNAPAIVLCGYGRGLVLGISPHPEATQGLTPIELNAIHWLYNHRNQNTKLSGISPDHKISAISTKTLSGKSFCETETNNLSTKIYNQAEYIFEHTQSSHYEHLHEKAYDLVKEAGDTYKITTDCSGFVSYIIESIAPKHYESVSQMSHRSYPHASTYAAFFQQLPNDAPLDGWLKISDYKNLQPGDIIAWHTINEPGTKSHNGGHVMIVARRPNQPANENFHGQNIRYTEIYVIDSSSIEHFPPQTLPPLAHQNYRDGIGKGMIRLMLNNNNNVIGFWEGLYSHEKNKIIAGPTYTNNVGFGRLISLIDAPSRNNH